MKRNEERGDPAQGQGGYRATEDVKRFFCVEGRNLLDLTGLGWLGRAAPVLHRGGTRDRRVTAQERVFCDRMHQRREVRLKVTVTSGPSGGETRMSAESEVKSLAGNSRRIVAPVRTQPPPSSPQM